MKTLISFLLAVGTSLAATAQNTDLLLQQYIQVKNALINADGKSAAEQAGIFLHTLETNHQGQDPYSFLQPIKTIAQTTDLSTQRKAFASLSEQMWKLVKSKGGLSQPVYYDYCPMKKAYWLSLETAIRNPYYGNQMLKCGNISDQITP